MKTKEHIETFSDGFRQGWDSGWDAHESYVEQKIMERDPAFLTWLEKMNRLSLVARERDELELMHQWAMQQDQDDNLAQNSTGN
jgi:uncharacterized protein YqeY